jgi:3',5'-nucleoside bisphosphate phosphatase
MTVSTTNLVLSPDSHVDLQVHTTYSDGLWTAEELIDHLASENFGLAAITDHDRPDVASTLQQLAIEKRMPLVVAVEMTSAWHGQLMDVLCFGFDLEQRALTTLANDLNQRQVENTREVYQNLVRSGYIPKNQRGELSTLLEIPSSRQPHALVDLVNKHGHGTGDRSAGKIVMEAGCSFATNEAEAVVDATHQSGGVALIAHPGREDGFICFDSSLLDKFRKEVPIDGLEVYYPKHSAKQTAMFQKYAAKHKLLMSAGSDSHTKDYPPIKYKAELIRALVERVGIRIA